ncbi:IS1380 family transposase [Orrella sp. 11846]|uniref:IS1380 family transposase n=1 Tax=Orrella sp. 11846 TaxID=3409913 RepID=UPI003B5C1B0B
MPNCTVNKLDFGRLQRRVIEADFQGGALSSDGGAILLRQVDQRIGLSAAIADALRDRRDPTRITHTHQDLVAQRLYALALGHEDLNDHDRLRNDPMIQTAVGRIEQLASSPTLCRFEASVTREEIVALNQVLVEQFIASFTQRPNQLILDIDASDIPLHGNQEMRQFHGYYDHYCYLPLYIYCGDALLTCVLRNSRIDGAKHAAAIIKLLVTRLRQQWPDVQIIVRGDSGFCRQLLINWCERNQVHYVIGLARNSRLQEAVSHWERRLKIRHQHTGCKQRAIYELTYGARAWKKERRVITRLEYGSQGSNPRYVVTNLKACPVWIYDTLYCKRGEAENRIKETQLDLFGTRTSCRRFIANWFRIMLSGLAYTLMQRLKDLALTGTKLANATTSTIRVRLLKIGAAVVRNTRRIRIMFASHHPLQDILVRAVRALSP